MAAGSQSVSMPSIFLLASNSSHFAPSPHHLISISQTAANHRRCTIMSNLISSQASMSKAPQACSACKRHKRRCDKQLPRCGLCIRTDRSCQYVEMLPPPTGEEVAALWDRIADLESRTASVNQVADVPPTQHAQASMPMGHVVSPPSEVAGIFLDWDAFTWLGNSVPKPALDIPDVRLLLGPPRLRDNEQLLSLAGSPRFRNRWRLCTADCQPILLYNSYLDANHLKEADESWLPAVGRRTRPGAAISRYEANLVTFRRRDGRFS